MNKLCCFFFYIFLISSKIILCDLHIQEHLVSAILKLLEMFDRLRLVQKQPFADVLQKVFLKILQYLQESTCVAGIQACSIIKKELQYKCFLWILSKVWNMFKVNSKLDIWCFSGVFFVNFGRISYLVSIDNFELVKIRSFSQS